MKFESVKTVASVVPSGENMGEKWKGRGFNETYSII